MMTRSTAYSILFCLPILTAISPANGEDSTGNVHDPANAVTNLDVHEELACTLFASEPMLTNPSNIEVDHRGRVWVCEIVNYRGHSGKRPEGDRILILEDTDGDAKADEQTVFYQKPEFISPHGICVLGTPDGKGTRAIVSVGEKVIVLTDTDGDDQADREEVMFTGIRGTQHDHGIHAFVFGPDGKLYFNMGNEGRRLLDKDGKPVIDQAGNEVATRREPYQEGLVFRCNLDGSQVETLGWNFRNNWEVTVDSFGTIWQSDNDDDGNKGVRINYVMEFGNYGYKDELTGAGWNQSRTGMHEEVPKRHWHLNDPGVVPTLLLTGAGSPVGITIYEGELLPVVFQGEMIHCDAGPSVVRAYPVEKDGAGYTAEIVNLLEGTRNNWFRPADVSVAPDGSLIVADWYDPGVGGHAAGDLERGRLFRITPRGKARKYAPPEFDFSSAAHCVEALENPNYAVRYIAWTQLHEMGEKAEDELKGLFTSDNPRHRARALWLLGKIGGRGEEYVTQAIGDEDPNIRIVGIRLARQLDDVDEMGVAARLVRDASPQVRRECAIALRHSESSQMPELWAELAAQHDGEDGWYLEALGIAAEGRWDECLGAWLAKAGGPQEAVQTQAGRDIIWRSRAKATPALLAMIVQNESTPDEQKPRYMRAFDFLAGPEKDAALKSLLGL
jgi:putative membrane-bound dehydrogenase-like protein